MLTQSIESYYNSSKAHQDYLNSIERSMSIRNEYERAKEREKLYQEMIEEYKTQLEEIRKAHCRLTVGETMIRLLHTKNDKLDQNMSMSKYAELFTHTAIKAQKVKYKDARFSKIFHSVLEKNEYHDSSTKSRISREHVILMCLSLGWSSDDVNYILLRSLDDDGLNFKSVEDLAALFALDAPGANNSHYRSIRQTLNRRINAAPEEKDVEQEEDQNRKKDQKVQPAEFAGTAAMANAFQVIIKKKKSDVDKKKELYIEKLTEYKEYLNSPSETARQIFARVLQFRYKPEDQEQGVTVEKALEIWVLSTEHPALTEAELRKLKSEAVCYGQDSWSVPYVDHSGKNPKLLQISLSKRVDSILDGTLQVNKKDMLFALFHVCAQYWEKDKTTDAEVLENRLSNFKELCKKVLEDSLLPPFYLPHPLEYTIACSVLSGPAVYQTFDEIMSDVDSYEAYWRNYENASLEDTSEDDSEKKNNTRISALMRDDAEKSLNNCLQKMKLEYRELIKNNGAYRKLMEQLHPVADKIANAWDSISYDASDFVFEQNGKIGFLARGGFSYLPYYHILTLPQETQDLFWNMDLTVSIPVYVEGTWTTLDAYIQTLFKKPGEKPKQERQLAFRYRRKVLLNYLWYLIQEKAGIDGSKPRKRTKAETEPDSKDGGNKDQKKTDGAAQGKSEGAAPDETMQIYAKRNLIMKLGAHDREKSNASAAVKNSGYGSVSNIGDLNYRIQNPKGW